MTHTPLDGLPRDPHATYIVVARHPLDAAVSLFHHRANIDRRRWRELAGLSPTAGVVRPEQPLAEWLELWIDDPAAPVERMDGLAGFLHHASDAWQRRREPHVVLVHYADLLADLGGQMRTLAARIGEDVSDDRWPSLVRAAGFAAMQSNAAELVPDRSGVIKDAEAFFRAGRSGAHRDVLPAEVTDRYYARAAQLAPPDLLAWLHRG